MFKLSVVSPSATYALVGSLAATDEGANVTITLNTTGVQRSQSLPFTISGTGITLEDFEGLTQLTGSFVVGADGTDTVNLSVRADQLTEGQETFTVTLLDGLASVDVILNDTSLSAALFNSSTTLLLRADGANNQNNNVFVDSSSNNFAITRVGNTTQGSFSPFVRPEGQWGVAFDGGSLAVNSPPPALVDWYSGTFTIEAWIYPQTLTGWHYLDGNSLPAAIGNASTTAMTNLWSFGPISNGTVRMYYWNGTQQLGATSTQTVNIGQWNHIAMCKNASNQVQIFVNGVGSGWIAINGTPQSSSGQPLTIGRISNTTPSGMISNVRIVSGAALYTANFTPSTSPLTAVAGTQLLTCQSNRFRDNSTNNFTITPTGTPRVVVDSPFAREYNPATMGGSVYFDGVGDILSAPNNPAFLFGSGEFTVETWVYVNDYPTAVACLTGVWSGLTPGKQAWGLFVKNNGNPLFIIDPADTEILTSTVSIHRRTWNHLAVTRSGNNYTMFVNGQVAHTATLAHTMQNGTGTLDFGNVHDVDWNRANVYLTDTRITKGVALYTAPFTPPAAPLTSTAQTSFLLGSTNGGIVDSTGRSVLETVGNARISTAVVRPGQTSSMFFDGIDSVIMMQGDQTPAFHFGTTDFTIEFWMYYTGATTGFYNVMFMLVDSNNQLVEIRFSDAGFGFTLQLNTGAGVSGANVIQTTHTRTTLRNRWAHVAVARSGGTTRIFVDGILVGSGALSYSISGTSRSIFIGRHQTAPWFFQGYLDDIRVTKGTALYTEKFTPPTSL